MDISANEHSVEGILKGPYRMEVPEYQRKYAWDTDQWEALWNDLQEIEGSEKHFLGSIVVIERDTAPAELDVYEVVDGQQRLATISIILSVMRWTYEEERRQGIVTNIEEYLWEEDVDGEPYQNLRLGRFDNEDYRTLIEGELPPNEQGQIRKAASHFAGKISGKSSEELDELRSQLLRQMEVVLIDCDSEESAFRLFETLNDRGLDLSAIDLMKNHLFRVTAGSDSYSDVKDDWATIIENIQYELDQPRRFFMHYLLSAPEPDIREAITRHTLYDYFREVVDERLPESELTVEEYISDMVEKSSLYVDLVNAEITHFSSDANETINDILSDLSNLGFTQERTLLLGALRELDNPTEVIRVLRLVESFIVRRRMTDSITGSSVNELHARLCSEAFGEGDPINYLRNRLSDRSPDNELLVASMGDVDFKNSPRTEYFLKKFEQHYYRDEPGSNVSMSGEIEHVAPRRAFTANKYSSWPDYLGVSEEEFESHKDKIGNLILLEQRLNAEAQDDPFDQKREEYLGSEFEMAKSVAEYEDWTMARIEERTEELAQVAPQIWNFDF